MILDTLAQWRTYAALSPRLAKGFAFLETVSPTAALGRHEIDGDDVFALVQRYTTKPIEERVFESHRKYIDIQYVLQGREVMCWAPLPLLPVVTSRTPRCTR
jgi:YhcH/YjgK/YiaL family protein